jgi:hypothetical protein
LLRLLQLLSDFWNSSQLRPEHQYICDAPNWVPKKPVNIQ